MKPTNLIPLIIAIGICAAVSSPADEAPETGVSVQLFVIPDCPIVNRYVPEINRIYDHYVEKGVQFTLVYTEPSLSKDDIALHRKEYSLKPKGILDAERKLVKLAGATITPEAAVYNSSGEIVYLGRIDDWFTDWGDRRLQPSERNLRLALDAVLAGEDVKIKSAPAIGCFIE